MRQPSVLPDSHASRITHHMVLMKHRDSFLIADCGSSTTRAFLVDLVDGVYRLIASGESATTTIPPDSDITLGLRQAISHIEATTGRRLLGDDSYPIVPETGAGEGVDAVVATVSAARPLRMAVAGIAENLSVAAALRAVQGTYAVVQQVFALDSLSHPWGSAGGRTALVDALQRRPPEVVVLVGGTDGGASVPLLDLADTIGTACAYLDPTIRPHIILSANEQAREALVNRLANVAILHPVPNLQPDTVTVNLSPLHKAVERLYLERRTDVVPGIDLLRQWALQPIALPPLGLDIVARFLARSRGLDVLVADLGGGATTLAGLSDGCPLLTVAAELGTSRGGRGILAMAGSENIARWLPSDWGSPARSSGTADTRNEGARGTTGPFDSTSESSLLERALAHEALRLTMVRMLRSRFPDPHGLGINGLPPLDLIIGSGGVLARAKDLAEVVLILLDGLQPQGITNLALDADCILPSLGALARFQPLAAAQVLHRDALLTLGPVVAPLGQASPGEPALHLKMQRSDGSSAEKTVKFGTIEVLPLATGQRAILEIRPTHRFDIGLGHPGKSATTEVEGGTLGLVVDARGRPLVLPADDRLRDVALSQWRQALRSNPRPHQVNLLPSS